MKKVVRIDEWKDDNGDIVEVEITFDDGSKVVYSHDYTSIVRKGNL